VSEALLCRSGNVRTLTEPFPQQFPVSSILQMALTIAISEAG
jgi:hypothetical protein